MDKLNQEVDWNNLELEKYCKLKIFDLKKFYTDIIKRDIVMSARTSVSNKQKAKNTLFLYS